MDGLTTGGLTDDVPRPIRGGKPSLGCDRGHKPAGLGVVAFETQTGRAIH
jgi:hypothetical protein